MRSERILFLSDEPLPAASFLPANHPKQMFQKSLTTLLHVAIKILIIYCNNIRNYKKFNKKTTQNCCNLAFPKKKFFFIMIAYNDVALYNHWLVLS